uniref:MAGE domain-containing protein n=1 Tax=Macrostomum lignano TaxID=282301 RepID=A0A1I8HEZ9_9PLAT
MDEWVDSGQSQDDELYMFAKRFLRMLQLKDKLNNSIEQAKTSRNKERIAEVLRQIDDEFFSEEILVELSADMRRALDVYRRFDRIEKITIKPLNLDEKSKLELTCYANPDQDIHATVMAVLLIMGFYEKRTRKWKRCQPIVKTLRVADFNRLDPTDVHPAIAARSKEIVANLDIREVALKSAAAAAFFDWTLNVVAAVGELSGDSDAQPASIRQQKKILKVPAEEDADLDWEDRGKRVQTGVRGRKTPKA